MGGKNLENIAAANEKYHSSMGNAAAGKAHEAQKGKALAGNIASANNSYYTSKGNAIYSDFSTFAQGSAIATANAIEFARDFSGRQGELDVCEYGIGNGNFANVFLAKLQQLSPFLYARTRYHLFDLSEKMLADAEKSLAAHASRCSFCIFDAAFESPSLPFDYCRINELLSDLPAELYTRKGAKIFREDGKEVSSPAPIAVRLLGLLDAGRAIPFSFTAEKFLSSLCACGKQGFRVDIFDYGFYFADDITLLPAEEWNRVIVRKYGSQITVDLNFLQLSSALAARGFSAQVEMQRAYCERALGMPLELRQTARGLDYARKKEDDGISEDDGFYHLRAEG